MVLQAMKGHTWMAAKMKPCVSVNLPDRDAYHVTGDSLFVRRILPELQNVRREERRNGRAPSVMRRSRR